MAFCRRGLVTLICICLLVIMSIDFIKFLHVFIALSMLGATFFCLQSIRNNYQINFSSINKILALLSLFALLTGTLLVHPKQFNFTTPWIMAAFGLLSSFVIILFALNYYKYAKKWSYALLLVILFIIMHDAVTKTTFI